MIDLSKAKRELLVLWTEARKAGPGDIVANRLSTIIKDVEALEKDLTDPVKFPPPIPDDVIRAEVIRLLRSTPGATATAVKYYRDTKATSLRDAMYYVDGIRSQMNQS